MEITDRNNFSRVRLLRRLIFLGAVFLGVSILSLSIGPAGADLGIILRVRLPRVLLAAIVGGTLAMSGAVFQGVLRNPLADPYILGTSTGGALGAAVGLIVLSGSGLASSFFVPVFAFSGSFITTLIVYLLSRRGGRVPRETLLLSGVIVGTLFGALIMFLMMWADKELHEILYVLMGFLGVIWTGKTVTMAVFVLVLVCIGGILIYYHARDLNLLSLGEENAFSLGVDVERTKLYLFFAASLITGAVVSLSGLIGFVGLIVPHIVRMSLGTDNRTLIPASLLVGSSLLIVSDTVARSLFVQEIPVGVVTALFGTPFFIYLLRREGKSG